MGATVFNSARVKSRMTARGQVAYLWEENTHCIKDGPKQASWCAMGFGNKADIIRRIYGLASSIPDGMLKVSGRSVTAFVNAMLKLLDEPYELLVANASLENHSSGFYTAIHNDNRPAVREFLVKIGRGDLAETIAEPQEKASTVFFSLDTDFEAIRGIINDVEFQGSDMNARISAQRGVPVWRVFPSFTGSIDKGPTDTLPLGDKPKLDLKVFETEIDLRYAGAPATKQARAHFVTLNGELIHTGTLEYEHYELKSNLVKLAGGLHVSTGHNVLRPLLKELEECVAAPSTLPADTGVVITNTGEPWVSRNFEALRVKLCRPEGTEFTATVSELEKFSEKPSEHLRNIFTSACYMKIMRLTSGGASDGVSV